ncbi:conserved hypothetical protein [Candidatus Zixiibacteriota bacterium]|nr:conserved hypothetical protein [candidate division Zixibacteria bacterium]
MSTLNPIHFEDLEPHRFEDLVRHLIYDFRDWQNIEAIGRDEGIDIRAWEKARIATNQSDEKDEDEGEHVIDGNLWVIQCKRESKLGPSGIKRIVSEFSSNQKVYGYILVAPADFSKKSHDIFREEIRKKGITECYLWGKAALEDILLMPKNDHILFAFFGISLLVKRRTRVSEVRFRVNNKNKLFRIFGSNNFNNDFHAPILIRDIAVTHYPFEENYEDFKKRPRWEEFVAYGYQPEGLLVHMRRFYAHFDPDREEYDYAQDLDLLNRMPRLYEKQDPKQHEHWERVTDFWRHLPRRFQAYCELDGVVEWQDILLIDDKGDALFECPHIYVEGRDNDSLIPRQGLILDLNRSRIRVEKSFVRKSIFPKKYPPIRKLAVTKGKMFTLDPDTKRLFTIHLALEGTLFDVDKKYRSFKAREIIQVSDVLIDNEPLYLEITYRYMTTVNKYCGETQDPIKKISIEKQAGRKVNNNEKIDVLECQRISSWQLKD